LNRFNRFIVSRHRDQSHVKPKVESKDENLSSDQLTPDVYEPSYRSGSAARLAGIPVETLRV